MESWPNDVDIFCVQLFLDPNPLLFGHCLVFGPSGVGMKKCSTAECICPTPHPCQNAVQLLYYYICTRTDDVFLVDKAIMYLRHQRRNFHLTTAD